MFAQCNISDSNEECVQDVTSVNADFCVTAFTVQDTQISRLDRNVREY
jgi:hypothetical protein